MRQVICSMEIFKHELQSWLRVAFASHLTLWVAIFFLKSKVTSWVWSNYEPYKNCHLHEVRRQFVVADLPKSPLTAGRFQPTDEDLRLCAAEDRGGFWCMFIRTEHGGTVPVSFLLPLSGLQLLGNEFCLNLIWERGKADPQENIWGSETRREWETRAKNWGGSWLQLTEIIIYFIILHV